MIYAACVLYKTGGKMPHEAVNIQTTPFLVEADNYDEALGKATRIGNKTKPLGADVHVQVNDCTEPITFEGAVFKQ